MEAVGAGISNESFHTDIPHDGIPGVERQRSDWAKLNHISIERAGMVISALGIWINRI